MFLFYLRPELAELSKNGLLLGWVGDAGAVGADDLGWMRDEEDSGRRIRRELNRVGMKCAIQDDSERGDGEVKTHLRVDDRRRS